jgi:hypothetical protein
MRQIWRSVYSIFAKSPCGSNSNLEDFLRHRPHILARDLDEARRFLEVIVLGRRDALPAGSEGNSFFMSDYIF